METEKKQYEAKLKSPPLCKIEYFLTAVKLTIVVSCVVTLIVQASSCFQRYISFETTAIMALKPTGEAPFISFTFCPDYYSSYHRDRMRKEYGIDVMDYQKGRYNAKWNPNKKGHREIFEEVTLSLSDLLDTVFFETWDPDTPIIPIHLNGSLDPNVAVWTTKYYVTFGYCFSLDLKESASRLGIAEMHAIAKRDMYIYLHHRGQFQDYDTTSKIGSKLGRFVFIDITYEVTIDTLKKESSFPCSSQMNDLLDECLYRKSHDVILEEFNCTLPFIPAFGDSEVCDPLTLGVEANLFYNKLKNTMQRSLCQKPCAAIEIFSGMPFSSQYSRDLTRIKVYLKTSTKVKKAVPDYPLITMLAEVGGYTGLLLGISLVHITSVLDKFCHRVVLKSS